MKTLITVMSLIAVSQTVLTNVAKADPTREGYRYQTTYSDFDRGFHSRYNYTESNCSYSGYYGHTCYNYAPTTTIYVEERHLSSGYGQIYIYNSDPVYSPGLQPYATYYVNGTRIERRDFYNHRYYPQPYYYTYSNVVVYQPVYYVELKFDSGWDKILTGLHFAAWGLAIAAESNTDAGKAVGLTVAAIGGLSSISGSDQLQKESDLQKAIKASKGNGTDVK